MSVDNRYTGVGYEPPFKTVCIEHYKELEAQLEREQTSVNELSLANQELHERIKVLEDALKKIYDRILLNKPSCAFCIVTVQIARAALEVKP